VQNGGLLLKKFLIVLSYINIILYIVLFGLFDYILESLLTVTIAPAMISFIKILFIIIIGFLIGFIISILRVYDGIKSYFDYKNFLILGIVPLILLILSGGQITNFIITNFLNGSKEISELTFYLFSRDIIWSLWLGVAIGSSVRIQFKTPKQLRIMGTL
jgi:hypothetical protein